MKRRSFLKLAAATGAAAALGPKLVGATLDREHPQGQSGTAPDAVDARIVRSVCLMCHGGCGIQVKVNGGVAERIDGNPFHPNTYDFISGDTISKESDLDAGADGTDIGSVCPKGAAGIYTLYNPRRLLHPVKRVGARGDRKWKRVSWDDAYSDLINGGNLFPGEGHVDGLAAIKSDEPIDSADSDYMDEAPPDGYGPKKNLYLWMRGRNENSGQTRIFVRNYGTMNEHTHWTICETTRNAFLGRMGQNGHVDIKNCDYLIAAGWNFYDAGFPMQTIARHMSKYLLRNAGTKVVYLGPREGKVCNNSQAEWVPVKTGTDAGFFMGMIKYIIDNELYDADLISRPNEASAGSFTYNTDFTHLVSVAEPRTKTGDCSVNGVPTAVADATGPADLEAGDGATKTVFTMVKERVNEHTMAWYNDFCGLPSGTIERIASEFANAERPCADLYKGPCQHANGRSNVQAIAILNMLMGAYFRDGGFSGGGGAFHGGVSHPEPIVRSGITIDRGGDGYAGSKATPTKPWFPLHQGKGGDGIQQETYAGISSGYPYKLKAMSHYRSDPVFGLARAVTARKSMDAVPLTFAFDQFMNETTMLCDYAFPDVTYLEHWSSMHTHGPVKSKADGIRQPVVGTVDRANKVYKPIHPDTRTITQMHIDLALKMGLPNVGAGGIVGEHGAIDYYGPVEYWEAFYNHGDYEGGIDPDAVHMKMGGKFQTQAIWATGAGGYNKQISAYPDAVASTKNSLTGNYMDGLPRAARQLNGNEEAISVDTSKYTYEIGTHKDSHHTQCRTAENLWLMSLEPENGLEMNPADAANLRIQTGDWVELENMSGDKGKYKVMVTGTQRPGYGEVKNSFGHWELGSRSIDIDGHENGGIRGDARVGAGFNITYLMAHDPAQSGDKDTTACPSEPIEGSAKQYGYPVSIRKV